MIFSTLESNSIQGHEAAIGVFTIIRKYIDDTTIRKLVLPKAKALFYKSTSVQVRYGDPDSWDVGRQADKHAGRQWENKETYMYIILHDAYTSLNS